jgi:hypothetical protein
VKIIALVMGAGVGLLLTGASAHAGPCSTEIQTLTQTLANAGGGSAHMPKAPSTAGTLPADPFASNAASTKTVGAGEMPKAPESAGTLPANPLVSTEPGGAMSTATGNGDAAASLQRARELDQAGDEAGCMTEVSKAKELIGAQ